VKEKVSEGGGEEDEEISQKRENRGGWTVLKRRGGAQKLLIGKPGPQKGRAMIGKRGERGKTLRLQGKTGVVQPVKGAEKKGESRSTETKEGQGGGVHNTEKRSGGKKKKEKSSKRKE